MSGTLADPDTHDIAVIGGGVVGLAVLRELSLHQATCVLLEKGPTICTGASSGNSGIWHTGFDADPGSLESELIKSSNRLKTEVAARLGIKIAPTGAIMVAWTPEDLLKFPEIIEKSRQNGHHDIKQLDISEIYSLEPSLSAGALGGIFVGGEGTVDPSEVPCAYFAQAIANGAKALMGFEVVSGDWAHGEGHGIGKWKLTARDGRIIEAATVINCAGLYGDIIDQQVGAQPPNFEIRPRRGQFLVYTPPVVEQKLKPYPLSHIILPVPSAYTKGVLLTPTFFGGILVGPTAEQVEEREAANARKNTEQAVIRKLDTFALRCLPLLSGWEERVTYAGLRPATEHKDYQIRVDSTHHWISCNGIRSTGLTASLGIGAHIAGLYTQNIAPLQRKAPSEISWPGPQERKSLFETPEWPTHPLTRCGLALNLGIP